MHFQKIEHYQHSTTLYNILKLVKMYGSFIFILTMIFRSWCGYILYIVCYSSLDMQPSPRFKDVPSFNHLPQCHHVVECRYLHVSPPRVDRIKKMYIVGPRISNFKDRRSLWVPIISETVLYVRIYI